MNSSRLLACFILIVLMLHKTKTATIQGILTKNLSMDFIVPRRIREALTTTTESHANSRVTTHTSIVTESTTSLASTNSVMPGPSSTDNDSSQSRGDNDRLPCGSSLRTEGGRKLATSNSGTKCNNNTQTLYVLSLLPYPDPVLPPSWVEGPTLYLAAQLAVELINKCCDILPGYKLELVQGDSGCDIQSKAYMTFLSDLLYAENDVVGMFGPGCSASATSVSPLSGHSQTALINIHIAGSLLLTDRTNYPYSFGTLDSTEIFVDALLALMELNEWTTVSALYDENRVYYYSTLQLFEKRIQNVNYSLFSSAVYDTFIPLDVIKEKHIRIVILFVGPNFLSRILCLAYHLNMTYPAFQFVVISRVSEEIVPVQFYHPEFYSCGTKEINTVKNGVLIIHYQLRAKSKPDVGISLEEFDRLYQEKINEYNEKEITAVDSTMEPILPSFWAPSYFDTVWSLALALHYSMAEVNLSNYKYGNEKWTNIIRENLLDVVEFVGLSGNLKFRNTTGYVTRNINFYQLDRHGNMSTIAEYESLNSSIVLILDHASFINGSFRTKIVYAHVSKPIGGIFLAVGILGLLLVVSLHVLTLIYRKKISVKASNPKLAQATFIGCYLLNLGLLSYFCIETFSGHFSPDTVCRLWYVLNFGVLIGSTLIFGSICARMYQLYRIYVHFRNPGSLISNKILLVFIAALVLVVVLMCTAWVVFNPFTPAFEVLETTVYFDGGLKEFVLINRVSIACNSSNYLAWFLSTSSFYWFLMVFALWLAIRTRNIPHKHIQTNGVLLLVYLLSGVIAMGLPIYFLSLWFNNEDITTQFVVLNVVMNIVVYFICILLFLPPLLPILRAKLVMSDVCVANSR